MQDFKLCSTEPPAMQPAPVPVLGTPSSITVGVPGKIPTPQNNQSQVISSLINCKLLFIPKLISL